MMAIVSLLIEYSSSAQSQKAGTAVCDILRALSEWESDMCDDGNIFPEEEIKCILNGQKSGIGIKRVLNSIVCRAGYFLVQYRKSGSVKRKTEVSDMELSGGSLLDDIRYTADKAAEEIHIGRDKDWADIPLNLIFVSKRHAELCRQNESWYITDLSSTNGTYVDGERVMPKQPVLIHDGSRIGIGLPQSELILHLP